VERLDLRHPPRDARGGPTRIQCAPGDSLTFLRLNGLEPRRTINAIRMHPMGGE